MTLGIILLLLSVIVFVIMLTIVLPKLLLKPSYSVDEPDDRGIRRYLYKGKRCIVYECGKENKTFIKQYLLLEGENCKILRCKTARPISYIDYDIVVFDKNDNVHKVINVKENLVNSEYTRRVELPEQTSYVRLIMREVNDAVFTNKPVAVLSSKKISLYTLIATLLTAIEVFLVKICCAYSFGGVFRESFIRSSNGTIVTILLAIAMGIIALCAVASGIKKYKNQ